MSANKKNGEEALLEPTEPKEPKAPASSGFGKEAKIGAAVILVLVVILAVVVVRRLTASGSSELAMTPPPDGGPEHAKKHDGGPGPHAPDNFPSKETRSLFAGTNQTTVLPTKAGTVPSPQPGKTAGPLDSGPPPKPEDKKPVFKSRFADGPPNPMRPDASMPPAPGAGSRYGVSLPGTPPASDPFGKPMPAGATAVAKAAGPSPDAAQRRPPVKHPKPHRDDIASLAAPKPNIQHDPDRKPSNRWAETSAALTPEPSHFERTGLPPAQPPKGMEPSREQKPIGGLAMTPPAPPSETPQYGRPPLPPPAPEDIGHLPRNASSSAEMLAGTPHRPDREYDWQKFAGSALRREREPERSGFGPPHSRHAVPPRHDGKYEIQPNDNFWTISERLYGTGAYFKALAEHNRGQVASPNELKPGELIEAPTIAQLQKGYPDLCPKPERQQNPQNNAALVSTRQSSGGGRVYTVVEGDTLFNIARYELGQASRWAEIYDMNRQVLGKDFNYLAPGTKLALPQQEKTDMQARQLGNEIQR